MFKPCLIIPLYNHGKRIEHMLTQLSFFNLDVLLVNDGSDEATRTVLSQLPEKFSFLSIIHHERNMGKGAAVITAFRAAHERGFTHAVQIDADDQHALNDIPKFLEEACAHPKALILGQPVFDSSAPISRKFGRIPSNAICFLLTGVHDWTDCLYGFRCYPLQETIALLNERTLGARMDFDIEIYVHLRWKGLKVRKISTPVRYHGDSHFQLIRDNLRIAKLFGKLIIQKLMRQVGLKSQWHTLSERGSLLGLRFMLFVYKTLGYRVCIALLYPVAFYFFVTGARARRAAIEYLSLLKSQPEGKQILGNTPLPILAYQQFVEFGKALVDRAAVWHGDVHRSDLYWPESAEFDRIMEQGKGGILLSAHWGNLEITRALSEGVPGLMVNALVFTKHAERFNKFLSSIHPGAQIRMISPDTLTPGKLLELKEQVERGEFLAILGDRPGTGATERTVSVPFLGKTAAFPEGPLVLAHLLECPVYLLFCMRMGPKRYQIFFEPLADQVELPRQQRPERLKTHLERYAKRLEAYCMKSPFQWFNFFPFWSNTSRT